MYPTFLELGESGELEPEVFEAAVATARSVGLRRAFR